MPNSKTAQLLANLPVISLGEFCIKGVRIRNEIVLDSVVVTIDLEAIDVQTGRPTVVHTSERVPLFALKTYKEAYLRIVHAALRRALEHEVDEWLTVDGVRAATPHPEETPR